MKDGSKTEKRGREYGGRGKQQREQRKEGRAGEGKQHGEQWKAGVVGISNGTSGPSGCTQHGQQRKVEGGGRLRATTEGRVGASNMGNNGRRGLGEGKQHR